MTAIRTLPPAQGTRSFKALWLGHGVSEFGTEISAVALPLAALVLADASPLGMGLIAAAGYAPAIAAPLYAGVVVDRVAATRLLLAACDTLRFGLMLLIPVAYWFDVLSVGLFVAVALGNSLVWNVDILATSLAVRQMLTPDRYAYANGRLEGTRSTARVAGPSLGGLAAQLLGPALAVLFDALSYLFSATQMLRIRPLPPPVEQSEPTSYWASVASGFRVVARLPVLRFTGLGSGANNFFFAAAHAIFAYFLVKVLGVSGFGFGLVIAGAGVGGVLGGFAADRIVARLGLRACMAGGIALSGATTVAAALLPATSHWWVVLTLFGTQVAAGVGVVTFVVTNASVRQAAIPEQGYAQTLVSLKFLSSVGLAPGALLGGVLAGVADARQVLAVASVGQILVGIVFFLGRRRLPKAL